jgi:hypothetical protein
LRARRRRPPRAPSDPIRSDSASGRAGRGVPGRQRRTWRVGAPSTTPKGGLARPTCRAIISSLSLFLLLGCRRRLAHPRPATTSAQLVAAPTCARVTHGAGACVSTATARPYLLFCLPFFTIAHPPTAHGRAELPRQELPSHGSARAALTTRQPAKSWFRGSGSARARARPGSALGGPTRVVAARHPDTRSPPTRPSPHQTRPPPII